jgi:aspartyl-tRNA(Asn)/glutamyl-tRNA(Gln) amidotransferase subunit B
MRSKEEANDYRYFPDPDLLPLEIVPELVECVRARCPSCPGEARSLHGGSTACPSTTPAC